MKSLRRFRVLPVLLAAMLLFAGCGGEKSGTTGGKATSAASSSAPKSSISGYYAADQSLGGGTDLKYINLKDIKIDKEKTDIVVTLEFKDGSLQMGMEEKETKGVPKYSTQWIKGLNRLVLNISGLVYWDYKVYEDELKDTPILGIFKQIPVDDTDTMTTRLYFNIKDNIAYRMEEKDNKLMIYIRALPEDERSDYYVMVDAFDEFTDRKVTEEDGLTPTLCSDKTNVVLISKPFSTEADATAFKKQLDDTVMPKLPGKTAYVKQLKNNQLPVFDSKGALDAYANTPVTKVGSKESTSPVLLTNGRILCWRPDGLAYVFVTPFCLDGDNGSEATSYEKIYICEVGSKTPTLLSDFEYSSIQKAAFSDDGRYLAFLDQADKRSLYICDTKSTTSQVATAAETGFGEDTANFTWGSGSYGHTIYAITGEGDTLQLMAYEIRENQMPRVDTLLENAFTEGAMGFYDGKVYYSQSSGQANKDGVFCFDPASRASVRISNGVDFSMNRKTGDMAILIVSSDADQTYDVKLYNPRTREGKVIVQNKPVADTVWADDGSRLYYTMYRDGIDQNDRFKLSLSRYDTDTGAASDVCDIMEGDLSPSDKSTEVLLTCLFIQENQYYIPITYRITAAK